MRQIYLKNYAQLINSFYLSLLRRLVLFLLILCLQLLLCRERICMYVCICQNPRLMEPTLQVHSYHHHLHFSEDCKQYIVIEDIPLCFNAHNKTVNYVKTQHQYTISVSCCGTMFRSFFRPSSGQHT